MSKRSRLTDDSSSSASSTSKKRLVSVATVDKWVLDHDKTLNTATWLTYEKFDRHHVALLQCSVCKRFEERIKNSWNFSPAFIDGPSNLRTSSFKDHAKSDSLCQLQERHGVRLGECYKNDQACAIFIKYIAQDLQGQLGDSLRKAKFYIIQMDGSTDSGNKEEELFLVVYFEPFSTDVSVHVRNRYLCVRQPNSVCATGLFEAFQRALAYLELDQQPSKDLAVMEPMLIWAIMVSKDWFSLIDHGLLSSGALHIGLN